MDSNEDPAERMVRQIQSSLSALGTDYIDSALIHWPVCLDDPGADHQAVRRGCWTALESLVAQKKVRHIGVSNYTCELLVSYCAC